MSEYTCSDCGTEGEVSVMFARPKKAGEKTEILCSTCHENEIAAAKAEGKDTPVFYSLSDSLARDQQHNARRIEAEKVRDRVLGRLSDEFLRRPNKNIVCVVTGRYHGEICWFKGGHFRITVVEKAYPINFDASEIVVEPVSNDARYQLISDEQKLAKEDGRETRYLQFHPLMKTYELAKTANERKAEKKRQIDRAAVGNNGRRGHYNNDRNSEPASKEFTEGYLRGQRGNGAGKTKIGEIVDLTPTSEESLLNLKTGTDDEPIEIDHDRAAREANAISAEKAGKNRRRGKGK